MGTILDLLNAEPITSGELREHLPAFLKLPPLKQRQEPRDGSAHDLALHIRARAVKLTLTEPEIRQYFTFAGRTETEKAVRRAAAKAPIVLGSTGGLTLDIETVKQGALTRLTE